MRNSNFSIRGPNGTFPWIAIINEERPMLMWASGRAEAETLVLAWNRRRDNEHEFSFELFSANDPNHHLGSARVVSLTGMPPPWVE